MIYAEEKLLKRVLAKHGLASLYQEDKVAFRKEAFGNPFTNPAWSTVLDGALKGMEMIALATFDWKLTGIVKLLQSWIREKREEKAKEEMESGSSSSFDQYGGYF